MNLTKTDRGFTRYEFTDTNGRLCSLQESSIANEARIWLGANEIDLKHFIPGVGWVEVPLTTTMEHESYIANTRIHLNQEQAAALLPLLEAFVKTGQLP